MIDAVGVDAQPAHAGPAKPGLLGPAKELVEQYAIEPAARKFASHFRAGDNPFQALDRAVEGVAKGGTLSIIGVYPPTDRVFPIGTAMNKNVTLRMGDSNHGHYHDVLIDHMMAGRLDPRRILSYHEHETPALAAYKAFD